MNDERGQLQTLRAKVMGLTTSRNASLSIVIDWIDAALATATAVQPEVERLVRQIHQAVKRGEGTKDHGVVGNLRCILDHVLPDIPDFAAVQPEPVAKYAARYAYLRARHWSEKGLCVTYGESIKLGHDSPSLDRLDAAIDDAMAAAPSGDTSKKP